MYTVYIRETGSVSLASHPAPISVDLGAGRGSPFFSPIPSAVFRYGGRVSEKSLSSPPFGCPGLRCPSPSTSGSDPPLPPAGGPEAFAYE